MPDENGPAIPETARRATVSSCRNDPVRAFAPVLTAMPAAGIPSATSSTTPATPTATPEPGPSRSPRLRPARPGPAPARPRPQGHPRRRGHRQRQPLLPPTPRAAAGTRAAGPHRHPQQAADERKTAEAARYKLGRLTSDDQDGYHRVQCPAAMGKIRCPLRPASMTLDRDRPEILTPRNIPRPAAHSRPSPSRRTCSPKPRRNTTTRPRPGAAPTPGAPAPSAASPPPRTPPATTSAAAGAASWAWHP